MYLTMTDLHPGPVALAEPAERETRDIAPRPGNQVVEPLLAGDHRPTHTPGHAPDTAALLRSKAGLMRSRTQADPDPLGNGWTPAATRAAAALLDSQAALWEAAVEHALRLGADAFARNRPNGTPIPAHVAAHHRDVARLSADTYVSEAIDLARSYR